MNPLRRFAAPGAIGLACALAACATLPPPTEELAAARAAIKSAEVANAATSAPIELTQAREKLTAAQLAVRDDESVRARRLAEEAQVDAQLAQAKASTARTREGLSQAEAALRALREEANRASGPATAAPGTVVIPVTPTR